MDRLSSNTASSPSNTVSPSTNSRGRIALMRRSGVGLAAGARMPPSVAEGAWVRNAGAATADAGSCINPEAMRPAASSTPTRGRLPERLLRDLSNVLPRVRTVSSMTGLHILVPQRSILRRSVDDSKTHEGEPVRASPMGPWIPAKTPARRSQPGVAQPPRADSRSPARVHSVWLTPTRWCPAASRSGRVRPG